MKRILIFGFSCLMLSSSLLWADARPGPSAAPDREGIAFFEKKIRPVLVAHCYRCHSARAGKMRGGLRVDTRSGLRKGGDRGSAVIPGKVADSVLIQALRHTDLKMPPKQKLSASVIADFEKWIARGAPDPRDQAKESVGSGIARATRKHWAFRPIRNPTPPSVGNDTWPRSPLDCFVLAALERKGLKPGPTADRRTWIRRVYLDVTGLPPTFAEVCAFEQDTRPDAHARVVDRLLASPHYGERWGRHWLDVARYADTKDLVLLFGKDRIRPYAYTYRDYVVRAFNQDLPYDQFIHDQLAADKITPESQGWRLAAMGFLTLGRLFDNNPYDIYDDQIDTVTRGMLGLTVACARCHDHKYDAIPQQDYYSLYGVFANSERPLELPLIEDPHQTPGYATFEKKAAPIRKQLEQLLDEQYRYLTETARKRVPDYLVRIATQKPDPLETVVFFLSLSPEDLRPQIVARWRQYIQKHARPDDPLFGPWHDGMQLPEASFTVEANKLLAKWQKIPAGVKRGQVNPLVQAALATGPLKSKADLARRYGEVFAKVHREANKLASLPGEERGAWKQVLDVVTEPGGPIYFPRRNTFLYMDRVVRGKYTGLKRQLDKLAVVTPGAPPRAMVLVDVPRIQDPHVFVRGNPRRRGQRVPRRFLQLLSSQERKPFSAGSGRLGLARAITATDNPLTARVMVNRVWMHHFGQPLVATPSDFGLRSEPPTHPQLLDHLAWTFQHEGWSLKKLHRRILLSATYQQASLDRPSARKIDPENRLYWRFPRRRLDLEAMRDSLLVLSGRLDRRLGGRPVDVAGDPNNRRRTLYGLVDRQDLPGLYRAFDFANPDQTAARRPRTTVPQQALFALNSPFMMEQARSLAHLDAIANQHDPRQRLTALHRRVLLRNPTSREIALGLRFLQANQRPPGEQPGHSPWEQYAHVLLMTNELMFVD